MPPYHVPVPNQYGMLCPIPSGSVWYGIPCFEAFDRVTCYKSVQDQITKGQVFKPALAPLGLDDSTPTNKSFGSAIWMPKTFPTRSGNPPWIECWTILLHSHLVPSKKALYISGLHVQLSHQVSPYIWIYESLTLRANFVTSSGDMLSNRFVSIANLLSFHNR